MPYFQRSQAADLLRKMNFGFKSAGGIFAFMHRRRGSTMVEAAIVFPIIVLSVLTVIYILLSMYSQTVTSVKLHLELAEAAADESGTRIYGETADRLIYAAAGNKTVYELFSGIETDTGDLKGIINKKIAGKGSDKARAKGLINRSVQRDFDDEIDIIDEEEYIRCADTGCKIIKQEAL